MNFGGGGGGGNRGGFPPFPNAGFMPPGMTAPGAFPGVMMSTAPGMQGMPPMPMGMPMGMQPIGASYPQGQGPLAGRPAQLAANGLYVAPELEGPEEHEGKQFIQLNVAEEMKYNEMWAEVSDGDDTVTGATISEFMQRAEKVSKGQLRTVWELSDHRKEGALDRDAFFIALRLLALAQRGAELSIRGLRNFVGIQLFPLIRPCEKVEPPQPPAPAPADASAPPSGPTGFAWTVPTELIARYDKFFDGLDAGGMGIIDGKQGFTFFSKSGLPRPTLRKIWQLADITVDGKLDREEFRQAMHLVTGVKNNRVTVDQFPLQLHPSSPFWLRPIGASPQMGQVPGPGQHAAPKMASDDGSQGLSPLRSIPLSPVHAAMPTAMGLTSPHRQTTPVLAPQSGQFIPLNSPAKPALKSSDEAEDIKAALQRERQEAEKTRREMEQMQTQLENIRLEKEAALASHHGTEVENMRKQYEEMAAAKRQAEAEAAKAKAELERRRMKGMSPAKSKPSPIIPPVLSPEPPASIPLLPPQAAIANVSAADMRSFSPKGTIKAESVPPTGMSAFSPKVSITTMAKDDDDDIWDQPSPEASKPKVNSTGMATLSMPAPAKQGVFGADDGNASSDDDDFWGMGGSGFGSKPTLGASGSQANKDAGQSGGKGGGKGAGFGGSELDDWLF